MGSKNLSLFDKLSQVRDSILNESIQRRFCCLGRGHPYGPSKKVLSDNLFVFSSLLMPRYDYEKMDKTNEINISDMIKASASRYVDDSDNIVGTAKYI